MEEIHRTSEHGRLMEMHQENSDQPGFVPTCQTCHMQDGAHGVQTAWGSLGVRLPFPWDSDPEWAEARRAILKGVRAIAPKGGTNWRLKPMTGNAVFQISESGWRQARDGMIAACTDCHPRTYAENALEQGDKLLREADILMARAIDLVAGLYEEGLLAGSTSLDAPYPDLLSWPENPKPIEVELYRMFEEYRPRTFKAALHSNFAFAQEQGLKKMRQALKQMEEMAAAMQ
jgi:cytochrome c553